MGYRGRLARTIGAPASCWYLFAAWKAALPATGFCDTLGGRKTFSCLDQYLYLRMTFAQLTHRESLCDIEVCLRAQKDKLYHRGIRGNVSRSAVADANER